MSDQPSGQVSDQANDHEDFTPARPDPAAENPHAKVQRELANSMLRMASWPGLATIVAGVVVSALAVGAAGLWGALVGGVVAAVACLATIVVMRLTAQLPPQMAMSAALGGYLVKIVILLGVMMSLRNVAALHSYSLALTALAVALVVTAAEVYAFWKAKIPTIIPAQ